jgi:hypothetical protein
MLDVKPIQIDIAQYEFGWYIQPYRNVSKGVVQYLQSDLQVASLLNMTKEEYVQLLMTNGAIDTANGITYFDSKEAVQIMQMIIETIFANIQYPNVEDEIGF